MDLYQCTAIIIIIFLRWSKTHKNYYYVLLYTMQHDRKRFGHFLAHSKCYY